MDPIASFPALSWRWSSLPQEVARLIKRFAWPVTPSAQAFKDAFKEDGDALTCRSDAVVMCCARSPICTQVPYRAFLGWRLSFFVSQTRYLGQRCCVNCCRYMQINPRDRTLCIISSADEDDYLGSDEDSEAARSETSSP